MRISVSSALEVIGFLLVLAAAFTWDIRAGIALVGSLCIAVGYLTGDEADEVVA